MGNVVRFLTQVSVCTALILGLSISAGCGQKGALYMPEEKPAANATETKVETTQSASPSNEEVTEQ